VLDLTAEFCRAGETLTGLSDLVSFRHGGALDLPYPDASFDVAWTQYTSMNVADKVRLYKENHRVLRLGGRPALHEILAGTVSPIYFPVPWAREPRISFLIPPETARTLIKDTSLEELTWLDETDRALEWFQNRLASAPESPPPLGLRLLLGEDAGEMFRNFEERRISIFQGAFERSRISLCREPFPTKAV
jgi:SAM-dependent methyltransferase